MVRQEILPGPAGKPDRLQALSEPDYIDPLVSYGIRTLLHFYQMPVSASTGLKTPMTGIPALCIAGINASFRYSCQNCIFSRDLSTVNSQFIVSALQAAMQRHRAENEDKQE